MSHKWIIRGRRSKGEVVRILERGNEIMVGTYRCNHHQDFVLPDDRHTQGYKDQGRKTTG